MNLKKKVISVLLMMTMLALLLPGGAMDTSVYADSAGLTPISSWKYATHRATTGSHVNKVYQLAKKNTTSAIATKLYDVMFKADYRPAVNGGSTWRSGYITSVYDKGLDRTMTFPSSQGCFSYANFISQYVHGTTGKKLYIPQSRPSVNDVKTFLQSYARPGEHFHFYNTVYGKEHSFIFLASDSEGFYVLSSYAAGNVDLFYCTYEKFHSVLRYDNGPPVVLYDTKATAISAAVNGSSSSKGTSASSTADPASYKVSFQRTLRYSGSAMQGSDVLYMQVCLQYLGYSITTDGWYGSGTVTAVKKFQTDHSLRPVDGICGSGTWKAVEQAVAAKKQPPASPAVTAAAPTVASLKVKALPDKQLYTVGESLVSSGFRLEVTYSNGTTKVVTSGFTFSPSQFKTAGQQKVSVSYGGKSTSFTVTVKKGLSSVAIRKKPDKLTYSVGDSLKTSGMVLRLAYSDGSTKDITSGFSCSPSQLKNQGQQKVVVTYGGQSTGFYVTVQKAVTSIAIRKKPDKLTYSVGDSLKTSGMVLRLTYSDGSTKDVTGGFSCSPGKLTKSGQQKVVVTYGGHSTGFYVTVR